MQATELLKQSVQEDWDAATNHIFCQELANGSLPLEKMRWYLVQDYKFIDQFVRLLATTIAHAPTLKDGIPAAQFLGLITSDENTYFLRSFEALGVSEASQNAPDAPATEDFNSLMAEARNSGCYEQMLAVLVVAEWSYLAWASRYVPYPADLPFWFSEWIDLHTGDGFESVVAYLRGQLDDSWDTLTAEQQAQATHMFQRAVMCERAFFDAAYAS